MRAAAVSVSTALTRVLVPTSLKNSAGDFVGDDRLAGAHAGEESSGDRGTTASGRWVGRGGATKADFPIRIIFCAVLCAFCIVEDSVLFHQPVLCPVFLAETT